MPCFTIRLLELCELKGTLDSEENEVAAECSRASRLNGGGGGALISTAFISLLSADAGLMWTREAPSAVPSYCGMLLALTGERFGERLVGVDALLVCEESLRGLPRFLGFTLASEELLSSLGPEGFFGDATMISSSITSFRGMRFRGIVNGLKKSLMVLLLLLLGGIASACSPPS
jgi:hypothetical protein